MRTVKQTVLGTALVFFAALACAAVEPADTVGINGKIYTVNPNQPWAEAIAIKGNTIVYVGDNEGAKAFIGKSTEVGNLDGVIADYNKLGLTAVLDAANPRSRRQRQQDRLCRR